MEMKFFATCIEDTGNSLKVKVQASGYDITTYDFKPNSLTRYEAEFAAIAKFVSDIGVVIDRLREEEGAFG